MFTQLLNKKSQNAFEYKYNTVMLLV